LDGARERRRARPVVICHEDQKRDLRGIALIHLTNESAASAFNIRFGINAAGVDIGWRHSQADPEPSRLNVLRPNEREPPDQGTLDLVIPDELALWSGDDPDPDEGRSYWAYYQSPAGDWWYTSNPASRSDDLTIKRIRSRRLGPLSRQNRNFERRIREGVQIQSVAIRELREGAQPEPPEGR
jgi:hypothetical protein